MYQVYNPRQHLNLLEIKRDQYGLQHIKLSQQINGVPIWGGDIIVHIRGNQVYRLDGDVHAPSEKINTDPNITPNKAESIAIDNYATPYKNGVVNSSLQILVDDAGAFILAYLVEIKSGLNRFMIFVDALNGKLIKEVDGMPENPLNK